MTALVAITLLSALLAPWLARRLGVHAGWLLALVPAATFAWAVSHAPVVVAGEPIAQTRPWVPGLGVELGLRLDGWSLPFVLLVSGLGAFVPPYAARYKAGHPQLGRLLAFLMLFMGAMLGLVLADDVITLFVFWELTSVASFLLIGFDHERERARWAAQQALLVTGLGGLAMLAGLLLLAGASDSTALSAIDPAVREHALYPAIAVLILAGAFTKSAQAPFHFWLPNAMEAPTPASAYLHSATMVKAGVYLLGRLSPTLGDTALWHWSLSLVGAATMLLGATLALRQSDLKRVLAYTTVTALGALVLLIGIGTPAAMTAATVLLVTHGLYKGALFFAAGAVDHASGTRDVRVLRGLRRRMPVTSMVLVVAAASMAGLPPLLGFVAKEAGYVAALAPGSAGLPAWLAVSALVLANAATVAAAWVVVRPVFGSPSAAVAGAREDPAALWLGALSLGGGGLALGLASGVLDPLVAAAAAAPQAHLALWHGPSPELLLSGVTFALAGVVVWRLGDVRRPWRLPALRVDDLYDGALGALRWSAERTATVLQSGHPTRYLAVILTTAVALVLGAFAARGALPGVSAGELAVHELTLGALLVAAAVVVAVARSRTLSILALGVVGFGVAMFFLMLGAPDVAMTQLLVETMVVVVALVALRWLPRLPARERSSRLGRGLRMGLAAGVGLVAGGLVLVTASGPASQDISTFFVERSLPEAFGRNVVNVILVDFRALDTLGEITVVAVAALGALALLRRGGRARTAPKTKAGEA